MGNCDTIHPPCISVQKLVTGLCTYQISPQAHLWKDEVTVRALGCQLPLDHSNIVAAVVLLPVTACKPSLSPPPPPPPTCECPNIQLWMAKCKRNQTKINLSGQAEPSSPHRQNRQYCFDECFSPGNTGTGEQNHFINSCQFC